MTSPARTSSIESLTSSSLRVSATTRVRPGGVQLEDLGEVLAGADDRADHEMPLSTVGKIGSAMGRRSRAAADADQPAAAAQRRVRLLEDVRGHRQHDGDVGAAERLDRGDRVGRRGVDDVVGAELAGQVQLGVLDVDGDDGAADDRGVLHGEVAEAADAEDRDPSRWAGRGRP